MAVIQNTYQGDGTTVLFSFTFPYLDEADIKVSLNGTLTTAYSLANATTIEFDDAPGSDVDIRIFRRTDDESLAATFYPGSAIRSQDLNENFTQNLYVTQEANQNALDAYVNTSTALANSVVALDQSTEALADSATALSQSTTALSNSTTAVSTADSAASQATTAVNTANAAIDAVAEALLYLVVADVAAIPGSPSDGDAVRVTDSTGIESFTPLSGKPSGFIGSSALTVEIYYSDTDSTWVWNRYYATDPEARYQQKFTQTTTAVNKTLSLFERCVVTASGLTITLPPAPTAGTQVSISVGSFADTTVARNGSTIMSLAENMTIDVADSTITLYFVNSTIGWKVI